MVFYNTLVIVRNCNWRDKLYISWEMTLTSIGGEKQAGISGGSQSPPADIASGRIAEVRSFCLGSKNDFLKED